MKDPTDEDIAKVKAALDAAAMKPDALRPILEPMERAIVPPRGSRADLRRQLRELHDQHARECIEGMATSGKLADVCDALFEDDERAATRGYDGVVERAFELVRERNALLAGDIGVSISRIATDLAELRVAYAGALEEIGTWEARFEPLANTEFGEEVDDPEALDQCANTLFQKLCALARIVEYVENDPDNATVGEMVRGELTGRGLAVAYVCKGCGGIHAPPDCKQEPLFPSEDEDKS